MRAPFTDLMAPERTPSRHGLAALPTAGLLVVTVLVSALTIGAALPAQDPARLPAPTTAFGISGDAVLMQSRVEALPLGTQWASLLRATLAPGAVWEVGQKLYDDDGPLLYRVESGALTIQAEQPISLTAAGATEAHMLPAQTQRVLHPGDSGFIPAGVRFRWSNDGSEPVAVLHVKLSLVGFAGACLPPPPGVALTPLIEQRKWEQPVQPILVTLRQVTLDARAAVPVEAMPHLELLYVVSGSLSAHDPPQAEDPSSLLVPALAGPGRPIDKGAAAKGTFAPGRVLRSGAAEAAVLLVLTIAPAETAPRQGQHPSLHGQVLAPVQLSSGTQGRGSPELRSVLREGAAACV